MYFLTALFKTRSESPSVIMICGCLIRSFLLTTFWKDRTMKTGSSLLSVCIGLVIVTCGTLLFAEPIGSAFTYQGRLLDDNIAADGLYDMQFRLYDDPNILTAGQIGSTIDDNDVGVVDGYFIAELDFGSDAFDGDARWLQVSVRPGASIDPNDFFALSPLQPVAPTPYALHAKSFSVPLELSFEAPMGTAVMGVGSTGEGAAFGVSSRDGDIAVLGKNGQAVWGISSTGYAGFFSGKGYFSDDVGIGTETPSEKLEVDGTVKATEFVGDGSQLTGIVTGDSDWTVSGSRMYSTPSGNVGIGTVTPDGKLQVTGDEVRIGDSGTVNYATGDGDLYVEDTLEVDGNVRASNMPGCEFSSTTDFYDVPTTMTNLTSVELTLDAHGYVIVTFSGTAQINSSGGHVSVYIGMTETMGEAIQVCGSSDSATIPFSVQHVYSVYPATHIYYGNAGSSNRTMDIVQAKMTAIYVPKRY